MPSTLNQTRVTEIQEKVSKAKSFAVVDYSGTTVTDQVDLRRGLRGAGSEMFVTKNTLINVVTDGKLKGDLEGMNALVLSYDDEVAGLKVLVNWSEDKEKLEIKGGMLGDTVLSPADVKKLSKLPGKNELIATLISRLQGPSYGLVNVLNAGIRNLVYAVKAIETKQAQA